MKITKYLLLAFIFIFVSFNLYAVPASWNFTSGTGNYATIGFSPTGTYTINGRPIAAGDAIGVFFTNNAQLYCAGYLVWNNSQYAIVAWGDNDQTAAIKEGFASSEAYTFKLWDNTLGVEVTNPTMTLLIGNGNYTADAMPVYSAFSGTSVTPLSAPTLTAPANQAANVLYNSFMTWNSVSNATSYDIQVSTSNTFATNVVDENTTNTSRALTGLSQGTLFYWRVRAKNATQTSEWSEVRSFTTVLVPSTPVLTSPANQATGLTFPINLVWNACTNTNLYNIQLSTSSNFSTSDYSFGTTNTSGSISQANLAYSTTYYWRVIAINDYTSGSFSEVRSFTTGPAPLAAPTLATPANQATGIALNGQLSWNTVANATSYTVQVSTANTFTSNVINQTTSSTSYNLSGLSNGTVYYWRIQATNATQTSEWSEVRSFATAATTGSTTTLNITALLTGLWNGTIQKPAAVMVELRSGSSLSSSTLYKRAAGILDNTGLVSVTMDNFTTGDYWVIVRCAGYAPVASASRQNIALGATFSYDFSRAVTSAYQSTMLISLYSRYALKAGDYDDTRRINPTDLNFVKSNNSLNSSTIPAL